MKNTLYGIGLDIGVASVGWAVVGLNGTGEPVGLHRLGVRIFDKAEQPKTGESLAAPLRSRRAPLGVSCTGGAGESGLPDPGGAVVPPGASPGVSLVPFCTFRKGPAPQVGPRPP